MSSNSTKHAWMAVGAVTLGSILISGLIWNCLTLYADPVINALGITRSAFMLTITFLSGANTVVSLFFYGPLEQKFSLRKMMLIGGLFVTVGSLLFAMSGSLPILYLGALFTGLGVSQMSDNCFNVACTYWFKRNRGTMISIVATIGALSGAVFSIIVPLWIASMGWRGSFYVTAAVAFVFTILIVILYKGKPADLGDQPMWADRADEEDVDANAETGLTYKEMLKTPAAWLLVIVWLLVGISGFAVRGNLVLFAVDYGYADSQGLLNAVLLVSCAILSPIGGQMCDKLGARSMMIFGMGSTIIACFLLMQSSMSLTMLFVCAVLLSFGWACNIVPIAPAIIENFGRKEMSKKSGLFVGMQCLGVAIGPATLSMFYDFGGGTYTVGLIVMAIMAALSIVLFFAAEVSSKKAGRWQLKK